jgi:hypothetical protein
VSSSSPWFFHNILSMHVLPRLAAIVMREPHCLAGASCNEQTQHHCRYRLANPFLYMCFSTPYHCFTILLLWNKKFCWSIKEFTVYKISQFYFLSFTFKTLDSLNFSGNK